MRHGTALGHTSLPAPTKPLLVDSRSGGARSREGRITLEEGADDGGWLRVCGKFVEFSEASFFVRRSERRHVDTRPLRGCYGQVEYKTSH